MIQTGVGTLIFIFRDKKVMVDADLALLYGVTTKALKQQVKRNAERFPDDFAFVLNANEKIELVTTCDRLHIGKFSPLNYTNMLDHFHFGIKRIK